MTTPPTQVEIDNGKYTITFGGEPYTPFGVLRYGEKWLDCNVPGAKAWIAAACEIEELRARVADLEAQLFDFDSPDIPSDGYFVITQSGHVGLTVGEGSCDGRRSLLVQFKPLQRPKEFLKRALTPARRDQVIKAGLEGVQGRIVGEEQ